MSQEGAEPDAHTDRVSRSDDGVATGRTRPGRMLLVAILIGVILLAGAVVAAGLFRGTGSSPDVAAVAFQPDGTRLGPVSGTEQTPLPDGRVLAFQSDDEIDVRDYVGQPLVVNFWASWCAPCIKEMPDIQQAADDLEGRVTVLGVNTQDSAEEAREFAADVGISFELVRDPSGSFFAAVGGFGWPTTLLVDDDGVIRYRHTGPLDADQLRDLLETHLGLDAS
jgi:thiol-disulfide isomerase/thioredoxin